MTQNRNLILVVAAFFALAIPLGFLTSWAYALVALLVGAMCVGGVAVASFVATKTDAPFSPEDDTDTELGESSEHSEESSAVQSAPR